MAGIKFANLSRLLLFLWQIGLFSSVISGQDFNLKEALEDLKHFREYSQEETINYNDELSKRFHALKRLKELNKRLRQMKIHNEMAKSENKDSFYSKFLSNNLWVTDQYSKAAQRRRYNRKHYQAYKRDKYSPAASECGVFKVKNENYYMWAPREKDYEEGGTKSMGEVEVDDPLRGLTEEEKEEKLKPICQKEKYDEPFRDPKIIEFLKSVYYTFLERSKNTSISQSGMKYVVGDMYDEQFPNSENVFHYKTYITHDHMTYLHCFVGMFARTPNIKDDDLFPRYLPLDLPYKYQDFYQRFIQMSKQDSLVLFSHTFDPYNKERFINPKKIRVYAESGYELSTYCDNPKADWDKKLSKKFVNCFIEKIRSVGDLIKEDELAAFYKKTGCIPQIPGTIVNPNAPYLVFTPDGFAYCRGHHYLLIFNRPLAAKHKKLEKCLKKVSFLKYKNNSYVLSKRHWIYGKIQLGLGIMRLERAFFGLYGSKYDELKLAEVFFDKQYFLKMVDNLYRVYFSKVLPRVFDSTVDKAPFDVY